MEKIIITIQRVRNYNTELLNVLSKVREYMISKNKNIPKVPSFGLSIRRHNSLVNIYCFVLVLWDYQAGSFKMMLCSQSKNLKMTNSSIPHFYRSPLQQPSEKQTAV